MQLSKMIWPGLAILFAVLVFNGDSICPVVNWTGTPFIVSDESEVTSGAVSKVNHLECLLHCRNQSSSVDCFYYADGLCSCLTNFKRRQCMVGEDSLGMFVATADYPTCVGLNDSTIIRLQTLCTEVPSTPIHAVEGLNDCVGVNCNNGECLDGQSTYTCDCHDGWEGNSCEQSVNECASSPCVHGACVDGHLSYNCRCSSGWVGTTCTEVNWILFQKRNSNSVSFLRNWSEYVTGFGTNSTNYWRGLNTIHTETATPTELQMVIVLFNNDIITLNYGTFSVGDAASKYLLSIGDYVSNTRYTESFLRQDGSMFTSQDSDNDRDTSHNAATYHFSGGWWYNDASDKMRPNALYAGNVAVDDTVLFLGPIDGSNQALKSVEMSYVYSP